MQVIRYISGKASAAWLFYVDGFRKMTVGRQLWIIILVKLAVIFLVLKIFFFPSTIEGENDDEKSRFVMERLMDRSTSE